MPNFDLTKKKNQFALPYPPLRGKKDQARDTKRERERVNEPENKGKRAGRATDWQSGRVSRWTPLAAAASPPPPGTRRSGVGDSGNADVCAGSATKHNHVNCKISQLHCDNYLS